MILFTSEGEPFRKGIRFAAKWLDKHYSVNTLDLAVFNANDEFGCMVPNQYWTPGMFAPMPIMGKYFSFYGNEFIPPRELGRKNVIRFVYELYSENSGSCRFHRKWVEDIIDEIITSHYDLDIDFWKINSKLVKEITTYSFQKLVPWESKRVVEIIYQFLLRWKENGLEDQQLDQLLLSFKKDKAKAAFDFWQEMKVGMLEAIQGSLAEPAHIDHPILQ
jgi:glyceraldehyde-3-phosphate dehydrogenase (ferredoxin)